MRPIGQCEGRTHGSARLGSAGESIDFASHEQRGCTLERLYSLAL